MTSTSFCSEADFSICILSLDSTRFHRSNLYDLINPHIKPTIIGPICIMHLITYDLNNTKTQPYLITASKPFSVLWVKQAHHKRKEALPHHVLSTSSTRVQIQTMIYSSMSTYLLGGHLSPAGLRALPQFTSGSCDLHRSWMTNARTRHVGVHLLQLAQVSHKTN